MAATGARPGRRMVSLGKVTAPKPINLPSQRRENNGVDPSVNLVSKATSGGGVWGGEGSGGQKENAGAWNTGGQGAGTSGQGPAPPAGPGPGQGPVPPPPQRSGSAASGAAWGGAGLPEARQATALLSKDEFPSLGAAADGRKESSRLSNRGSDDPRGQWDADDRSVGQWERGPDWDRPRGGYGEHPAERYAGSRDHPDSNWRPPPPPPRDSKMYRPPPYGRYSPDEGAGRDWEARRYQGSWDDFGGRGDEGGRPYHKDGPGPPPYPPRPESARDAESYRRPNDFGPDSWRPRSPSWDDGRQRDWRPRGSAGFGTQDSSGALSDPLEQGMEGRSGRGSSRGGYDGHRPGSPSEGPSSYRSREGVYRPPAFRSESRERDWDRSDVSGFRERNGYGGGARHRSQPPPPIPPPPPPRRPAPDSGTEGERRLLPPPSSSADAERLAAASSKDAGLTPVEGETDGPSRSSSQDVGPSAVDLSPSKECTSSLLSPRKAPARVNGEVSTSSRPESTHQSPRGGSTQAAPVSILKREPAPAAQPEQAPKQEPSAAEAKVSDLSEAASRVVPSALPPAAPPGGPSAAQTEAAIAAATAAVKQSQALQKQQQQQVPPPPPARGPAQGHLQAPSSAATQRGFHTGLQNFGLAAQQAAQTGPAPLQGGYSTLPPVLQGMGPLGPTSAYVQQPQHAHGVPTGQGAALPPMAPQLYDTDLSRRLGYAHGVKLQGVAGAPMKPMQASQPLPGALQGALQGPPGVNMGSHLQGSTAGYGLFGPSTFSAMPAQHQLFAAAQQPIATGFPTSMTPQPLTSTAPQPAATSLSTAPVSPGGPLFGSASLSSNTGAGLTFHFGSSPPSAANLPAPAAGTGVVQMPVTMPAETLAKLGAAVQPQAAEAVPSEAAAKEVAASGPTQTYEEQRSYMQAKAAQKREERQRNIEALNGAAKQSSTATAGQTDGPRRAVSSSSRDAIRSAGAPGNHRGPRGQGGDHHRAQGGEPHRGHGDHRAQGGEQHRGHGDNRAQGGEQHRGHGDHRAHGGEQHKAHGGDHHRVQAGEQRRGPGGSARDPPRDRPPAPRAKAIPISAVAGASSSAAAGGTGDDGPRGNRKAPKGSSQAQRAAKAGDGTESAAASPGETASSTVTMDGQPRSSRPRKEGKRGGGAPSSAEAGGTIAQGAAERAAAPRAKAVPISSVPSGSAAAAAGAAVDDNGRSGRKPARRDTQLQQRGAGNGAKGPSARQGGDTDGAAPSSSAVPAEASSSAATASAADGKARSSRPRRDRRTGSGSGATEEGEGPQQRPDSGAGREGGGRGGVGARGRGRGGREGGRESGGRGGGRSIDSRAEDNNNGGASATTPAA